MNSKLEVEQESRISFCFKFSSKFIVDYIRNVVTKEVSVCFYNCITRPCVEVIFKESSSHWKPKHEFELILLILKDKETS